MSKTVKTLLIVAVAVFIIIGAPLLYLKNAYNGLVTMDETVKEAWAQVENQLQRRYDLIPNLVETVKGYAAHEEGVFIKVTEARSKIAGSSTVDDKIEANNELSSAISRLLVVVEQYPELKANENFIRLQDELAGTENRISVERRRYNETVKEYNVKIRQFPTNIVAAIFNFEKAVFFDVPEERQEAPKVDFTGTGGKE
ncbi:MAG: LemA family protein [Deltaproteobacteria bacterium]|nr:LemA family protein [Deltaproteobacteria bacterium]